MKFFIHYVKTYCSVNQKGKEIQSGAGDLNGCLLTSESNLQTVISDLESKVQFCNEKYPRSKPLELIHSTQSYGGQITVRPIGACDGEVLVIGYQLVKREI